MIAHCLKARVLARSVRVSVVGLVLVSNALAQASPDYVTNPTIDEIIDAHRGDSRIVGGEPATPGQWPSMVAIFLQKPGKQPFNFCGGTVIGKQWVLTAAHCAAAMKRFQSQEGAVKFFVREGTQDIAGSKGRDVPVSNINMHDGYDPERTLNDVALLRLARAASVPSQKLVGETRRAEMQEPRRVGTVTGFGLVSEGGDSSARLRQVDVPIVDQRDCRSVYGVDRITEANFCAGEKRGGKDSCQGDSGGPLFVRDNDGQVLQAGVVSWGKGCARADYYGVYASVGTFQSWIRGRVQDAVFVGASDGQRPTDAATTPLTDGATTTVKPSRVAQVSIDIVQGDRVPVNSFIDIKVQSSVPGAVVIYAETPGGTAKQIYPSKIFPASGGDPAVARIDAGKVLQIPSEEQRGKGYRFIIRPPEGTSHLRAIVVPDKPKVLEVIRSHADGEPIPDLTRVINDLVDAELDTRAAEPTRVEPTDRGTATKVYQIIPAK